ncbi:MAG: dihydrolipoyl dehydrogenase [Candidatus Zhuqueibacterota bacterium]
MVVGDFTQKVDTLVIGAGPGGYVAAIRAAQLGQEVTLVEKDHLGGVCLNWGCIPSKAMIEVSGLKQRIARAADMGLMTGEVTVDLAKLHHWKDDVVLRLRKGIEGLLSKNGVDVVHGNASFTDPGHILVDTREGLQRFEFKNVVIATGSHPIQLPGVPFDGRVIIDSSDALSLAEVPKRMVVIGAGSVGIELGTVYRKLGADVTILENQTALLMMLEPEVSRILEKSLKKIGIDVLLGSELKSVQVKNDRAELHYVQNGAAKILEADKVLVAVGRRPNTATLGLGKLGLTTDDRGFIPVNSRLETGVKGVYAIGDAVAGLMLAHRASHMGKIAAEAISNRLAEFDNLAIPGVIFSDPEIATVGMTQADAENQGYTVKAGAFPFRALGRAMTIGETEGLTKVVSDGQTGTVLGVHIIGPHASDLIAEGALAVESASHVDDLMLTIHAHPTLTEGVGEAAEAVENKAIHIFNSPMKQ